jgi:chloride channel protein, CIC family
VPPPRPKITLLSQKLGLDLVARSPLALQILGRTLLHAALVGAACGLVGALFFSGTELVQFVMLEKLAGYHPLKAQGEQVMQLEAEGVFRPWLLWLIPAVGALLGGLVSIAAPEVQGGGADTTIEAFHHQGGVVRRRVAWAKALASMLTLGMGGSGGREGPTIQIGGALGSLVGRYLNVGVRERRILLLAGAAAGISAVFRTPLGAALLAVEVLYEDDFETDALVPAVLASVVSYSVIISYFGESTLFAHAPRYAFVPAHLPLYGVMALVVALGASGFVTALGQVRSLSARLALPAWAKPAVGGLLLGLMATIIIVGMRKYVGAPGQGFGVLGGGYGAAQIAITGADWLPTGWRGVEVLVVLGCVKLLATALTVGTGGSAGDFGPALVIGGLFGGAFGRAAQLLLHDPRIDAGAFALVGMGTFYGGIARAPLSSLVMVCEMAGSYDLLVPLMLAEGIAFVALRKHKLYHAQVQTRRDSPAHRHEVVFDALADTRVVDVMTQGRSFISFHLATSAAEVVAAVGHATWQDVFPVLSAEGTMAGVIDAQVLRTLAAERSALPVTIAADLMTAPISVLPSDTLPLALRLMLEHGVREIPVNNAEGRIVGFLDEADVTRAYLEATQRQQEGS